MSSIEQRVVSVAFDNANFERNVVSTIGALDKLKQSMQFAGTKQGLSDLGAAANNIDLSNISSNVENINSKFSVLGVVGFEAIRKVTGAAINMAKSLSEKALGPLLGGGRLRAENLEQARFLFRGLGMDVDAGMASALEAVKGTAFGLDAAAKAAAQLGGSGMQAGAEMTGALRGIAGTAAMTNTSFEEMADVFTSAAGKGKVSGYELQRIGQRGLNAAASLAKVWGTTEQEVRRMASEGEISFEKFADGMNQAFGEHATKANETYTGSLANMRAALSRIGASFFGPDMLKMRDLFNALTPVIDNVGAALKPFIDTLLQIKGAGIDALIGGLNNLDLSSFSSSVAYVSTGIRGLFDIVKSVMGPIKEAFREIFPKPDVSPLLRLSMAFAQFVHGIKMGGPVLDSIKSIFKGVFSVISIGIAIVKGVAGVFVDLFSALASAAGLGDGGGILNFFANLGESLADLKTRLVDGGGIADFFDSLSSTLQKPIELLGKFREAIVGVFGGNDTAKQADDTGSAFGRFGDRLAMIGGIPGRIGAAFSWLSDRLSGVTKALKAASEVIVEWFSDLGTNIANAMKGSDFNAGADVINAGLLGSIALLLKKFISGGVNFRLTTGVIENLRISFINLTRSLQAMQMDLRAKALLKIASAVAILAVSMMLLASIDSAALTKALIAMSVGFGQLVGAMVAMEKLSLGVSAVKLGVLGLAMIGMAIAVTILSVAIKNLAGLGWEELTKGLIGVAGGLGAMATAMSVMPFNSAGLVKAGVAMIGMAIALIILSKAVESFSNLSWSEMAQGMVGVGVGLGMLALAMNFMPVKGMIGAGLGMIAISVGLLILSKAVSSFADISWGDMAKGFVGVGVGLALVAGAMHLMPTGMLLQAAGLIGVGAALLIIASAVEKMGSIPFGEMAKGIGAIAVVMLILAVGLNAMSGAVAGAGALLVASAAMLVFSKVLQELAKLSIGELITGLVAMAATLAIFGAAAFILAPVVPVLFALGAALALLGGAFALFGLGASLLAGAFQVIAQSGKAGLGVFLDMINMVIAALPRFVESFLQAFIDLAGTVLTAAPPLVEAIMELLTVLLDGIISIAPQIAETIVAIISSALTAIRELFPQFVETGFAMLMALLTGIRDNIEEIVTVVADIITGFIDALTEKVPELVDSMHGFLMTVITEVAGKVGENATAFIPVGKALLDGFLQGLEQNVGPVIEWFTSLPGKILNAFKSLLGINSPSTVFSAIGGDVIAGFLQGLTNAVGGVLSWFGALPGRILGAIGNLASTLIPKGIEIIGGFLGGIVQKAAEVISWFGSVAGNVLKWIGNLASTLVSKGTELIGGFSRGITERAATVISWFTGLPGRIVSALGDLGSRLLSAGTALVQGLWNGIRNRWDQLASWVKGKADGLVSVVKKVFEVFSPSRVFMEIGENITEGLAIGIVKNNHAEENISKVAKDVVSSMKDSLKGVPDYLSYMDAFSPTITPVLDLTQVKSAARGIDDIFGVAPITPQVSHARAQTIATTAEREGIDTTPEPYSGPSEVNFEQNIYSPTALSTNDIYRSTKSQIVLAKEELSI